MSTRRPIPASRRAPTAPPAPVDDEPQDAAPADATEPDTQDAAATIADACTCGAIDEQEHLPDCPVAEAMQAVAPVDEPATHVRGVQFVEDEHDRARRAQRERVHEAATRSGLGATADEVIERDLDASHVRGLPPGFHPKWVNRTSRDGYSVARHLGLGFFFARPSRYPKVRPSSGIKHEDTWIWGDLVLMFETLENRRKRQLRVQDNAERLDAGYRAGVVDQLNHIIRDEAHGPAHRDMAYDNSRDLPEETRPARRDIQQGA